MSQYLPSFIRNSKGKYNPELGFVSIKGGTDAYLLEDELNEMQWIQGEARAHLIRQITKSGCLNIPAPNNPAKPGGIIELGKDALNAFAFNGFDAVLDGYIARIDTSDNAGFTIQLPAPPVAGVRYEFIYLEFWFKEVKQYEPVPRYGGFENNPVPYEIIDSRMNFETTQRVQLQWSIKTISNVVFPDILNLDFSKIVINPYGPNNIAPLGFKFSQSPVDQFLLEAGNGTNEAKTILGTLDGKVYAIPLFVVKRLNKSGYNPQFNPNGATDYVNENSVSGHPEGRFSNIIYTDQVIDVRHLSALGEEQYNHIFVRQEKFDEYREFVKTDIQTPLKDLQTDVEVFQGEFHAEVTRIDSEIDTFNTTITTLHQTDMTTINKRIGDLDATLTGLLNSKTSILDNKINSVNSSLTTYIDSKVALLQTEDAKIRTDLTNALNSNVAIINTSISNLQTTINNTINSQIATINSKLVTVDGQINAANIDIDTLEAKLNNINSILTQSILDSKNEATSNLNIAKTNIMNSHYIDISAVNKRIDDVSSSLAETIDHKETDLNMRIDYLNNVATNRFDNLYTVVLPRIDNDINAQYVLATSLSNQISNILTRVSSMEADLRTIQGQINSLFPDGSGSDLIIYGLDMNRKTPSTVGGNINGDGTITSNGILAGVTFNFKKDYSLIVVPQRQPDQAVPDGSIGDFWVEKADTSFVLKNTGSANVICEIFAVKNDNEVASSTDRYVWSNANSALGFGATTFAGNGSSTRVNISLRTATDFIYICPIGPAPTFKGEIGEIYTSMDSTGFNVYNTGKAGIGFEWTVIDTRPYTASGRLRNAQVYDLELPGQTDTNPADGKPDGITQAGAFGGNFYSVMVSTPTITGVTAGHTLTNIGSIGEVNVIKGTNQFTVYNTGKAVCKVRCIVFNYVKN